MKIIIKFSNFLIKILFWNYFKMILAIKEFISKIRNGQVVENLFSEKNDARFIRIVSFF